MQSKISNFVVVAIVLVGIGAYILAATMLKKENPRHFNLSLNLLIGDAHYETNYSWSCKQHWMLSAVSGWVLKWRSDEILVAKDLNDDLTVYFYETAYCGNEDRIFSPSILIGSGGNPPTITWVHNWNKEIKSKFKVDIHAKGKITKTEDLMQSGIMTSSEKEKSKWLANYISNYASRTIKIVPKSVWSTNSTITSLFAPLDRSYTAVELLKLKEPDARVFGFESSRSSSYFEDPTSQITIFQQLMVNKKIAIGASIKNKFDFHFEPKTLEKPFVEFCYLNECFEIKDGFNEIYSHPKQELLVLSKAGLYLDRQ